MNLRNIRAKLVALTVVDGDGKRLFSDADAKLLGKSRPPRLTRFLTWRRGCLACEMRTWRSWQKTPKTA